MSCRKLTGKEYKLFECRCLEQGTPALCLHLDRSTLQLSINVLQVLRRRSHCGSGKRIGQTPENTVRMAVVNLRIGPVEIAEGFFQSMVNRFEYEPLMPCTCARDSQT